MKLMPITVDLTKCSNCGKPVTIQLTTTKRHVPLQVNCSNKKCSTTIRLPSKGLLVISFIPETHMI